MSRWTSWCHGSWYARARSSTKVRTAARVSQTGEHANRTASSCLGATDQKQGHLAQKIRTYANHSPRERTRLEPMVVIGKAEVGLSYRDALASGELRALLAGQLVSVGGLSIASVALTILVYRRTASPLLASLTFAHQLPAVPARGGPALGPGGSGPAAAPRRRL